MDNEQKEIPKVKVKAAISLNAEATTKTKLGSGYPDEVFERIGVHLGSVLSPFLFAIMIG